jgi:hypothetical protein
MNKLSALRLQEGIHLNVPERDYHGDCADGVSASASILKKVYLQSPLHAKHAHPKLNPDFEESPSTDAQATGSILHAMVLGQSAPYRELPYDSYRTSAAKEARDKALDYGLIPILSHKLLEIYLVAEALRIRLQDDHPEIYEALMHEETIREGTVIWREDGVLCRCRFDALPPRRYGFSCDLKFTGLSADPEKWSRTLATDYLFQADLYPRAIRATRGDNVEFRFIVCETDPPYGVSVHAMGPDLADLAQTRVDLSLRKWSECLRTGKWPGYPAMVCYANAPGWLAKQDMDREVHDQIAKEFA